jgi:hypothetical protein
LPAWLAPVVVYGMGGAILAAIATSRIEIERRRRVGTLRILVALALVTQLFFLYGSVFARHWGSAGWLAGTLGAQPLLGVLMYPALVLLFCAPVFATGDVSQQDVRSFGAYLLQGWTPSGWRRGSTASGFPYLMLLVAIVLGMYFASFVAAGKPGAVLNGALGPMFATHSGSANILGGFPEAALCIIMMVVGLSSLGMLLSMITRNRWAALALSYLVVFFIFVAPTAATMTYSFNNAISGQSDSLDILAYAAYMNPVLCISELAEPSQTTTMQRVSPLGQGGPYWLICPLAYLFMAGSCLFIAALVAISNVRRAVPIPIVPR